MCAAGQVSWDVVKVYIKAMGGLPTFLVLVAGFLLAEAARVGATVWLSHWTGVADMPGALLSLSAGALSSCYECATQAFDSCSTTQYMPDKPLGIRNEHSIGSTENIASNTLSSVRYFSSSRSRSCSCISGICLLTSAVSHHNAPCHNGPCCRRA